MHTPDDNINRALLEADPRTGSSAATSWRGGRDLCAGGVSRCETVLDSRT